MKLTRRQEEFVYTLLDLYRELQEPFHYTILAERLGVSRFTAYDMLRLLEEKGLVTSEYQLEKETSGPGRSTIVFSPTERARRVMSELAEGIDSEDWEAFKERVLERARSGEVPIRDPELAEELLARAPSDTDGVIAYCVEIMTVMALTLQRRGGRKRLLVFIPQVLPASGDACRSSLSLLGGFALGVLAEEVDYDREWDYELLQHVLQYQALVIDMKPAQCRRLADSLRSVFAPLLEASA